MNFRKLNLFEKIIYYKVALIIFTIPFIYILSEVTNKFYEKDLETTHKISFCLLTVSIIILWKQTKDLKFKTYKTELNKVELDNELKKLATEFNWEKISSTKNTYQYKIKALSYRTLYASDFGRENKRYIDLIIKTEDRKFQINLIFSIENTEIIDSSGEIKQLKNLIINKLNKTYS